jgi:hypothetical protein
LRGGGGCVYDACVCVRVCVCAREYEHDTFRKHASVAESARTWIFELTAASIHAFTGRDYILRNKYNNIPSSPPYTVPIPSLPPFFIRVRDRILPRASKNIVPVFFSLPSRPMLLAPGLLRPDDAYGQLVEERHRILFFFEGFINAFFVLQFLSPSQLLVCCKWSPAHTHTHTRPHTHSHTHNTQVHATSRHVIDIVHKHIAIKCSSKAQKLTRQSRVLPGNCQHVRLSSRRKQTKCYEKSGHLCLWRLVQSAKA